MVTRCLTFESWLSRYDWYKYAINNKHLEIPLLTDRSPCSDPFFDRYSDIKRPLISGLCRARKNYKKGDRFVYITRIDNKVGKELGVLLSPGRIHYCIVASLIVDKIYPSHEDAAKTFTARQYVKAPEITSHPPNLITGNNPNNAHLREYCIVSNKSKKKLTPYESTDVEWKFQYHLYRHRKETKKLPVAECFFEIINGNVAFVDNLEMEHIITDIELQTYLRTTPKSPKMNIMGRIVKEEFAANLVSRITLIKK